VKDPTGVKLSTNIEIKIECEKQTKMREKFTTFYHVESKIDNGSEKIEK
jgi:hypothetical protein